MSLSCRIATICRWGWAVGSWGREVSWNLGELIEGRPWGAGKWGGGWGLRWAGICPLGMAGPEQRAQEPELLPRLVWGRGEGRPRPGLPWRGALG